MITTPKAEWYKKNVEKFALQNCLSNDFKILGCADVKFRRMRVGKITGRETNVIQTTKAASKKAMGANYGILMAIQSSRSPSAINFIMVKRPSDGKIDINNPLQNCKLETNFMNDTRASILDTDNMEVGIKRKHLKEDNNKSRASLLLSDSSSRPSLLDDWSEASIPIDEMILGNDIIFTIENTDTLSADLWKTIFKIQILDTSVEQEQGGWDGQDLRKILIDLAYAKKMEKGWQKNKQHQHKKTQSSSKNTSGSTRAWNSLVQHHLQMQ